MNSHPPASQRDIFEETQPGYSTCVCYSARGTHATELTYTGTGSVSLGSPPVSGTTALLGALCAYEESWLGPFGGAENRDIDQIRFGGQFVDRDPNPTTTSGQAVRAWQRPRPPDVLQWVRCYWHSSALSTTNHIVLLYNTLMPQTFRILRFSKYERRTDPLTAPKLKRPRSTNRDVRLYTLHQMRGAGQHWR